MVIVLDNFLHNASISLEEAFNLSLEPLFGTLLFVYTHLLRQGAFQKHALIFVDMVFQALNKTQVDHTGPDSV